MSTNRSHSAKDWVKSIYFCCTVWVKDKNEYKFAEKVVISLNYTNLSGERTESGQ